MSTEANQSECRMNLSSNRCVQQRGLSFCYPRHSDDLVCFDYNTQQDREGKGKEGQDREGQGRAGGREGQGREGREGQGGKGRAGQVEGKSRQ
eukprot:648922-Hanusia_phi.AAC.1